VTSATTGVTLYVKTVRNTLIILPVIKITYSIFWEIHEPLGSLIAAYIHVHVVS